MIIPYHMINRDTLHNIIEDFVTRDGTDNGFEQPLSQRIAAVEALLKAGEWVIVYEASSESINLLTKEAATALLSQVADEHDF